MKKKSSQPIITNKKESHTYPGALVGNHQLLRMGQLDLEVVQLRKEVFKVFRRVFRGRRLLQVRQRLQNYRGRLCASTRRLVGKIGLSFELDEHDKHIVYCIVVTFDYFHRVSGGILLCTSYLTCEKNEMN